MDKNEEVLTRGKENRTLSNIIVKSKKSANIRNKKGVGLLTDCL